MKILNTYLFDHKQQPKEVKWFKNSIALFLLYKCIVYVYLFDELFSENSFVLNNPKSINALTDMAYFLTNHYSVLLAIILIICIALFAITELFNKSNTIFKIGLWLIVVNINNFLYPTLTAGDYLLNQLLFFSIFLSGKIYENNSTNELSNALHNTALIGIKLQICMVYFISALFKLTDSDWLNGSALSYILQIPEYSNSLLNSLPQWLYHIITYSVLIYQLSFIILVWLKPLKKYIFTFGILQHLIIAFGMGLFSFGIIMIVCYILFLNYQYKPILSNA